ncbi:hypothetical protein [Candidatus Hamiltonella defensa]|nr:hypothetical protein [Candidatus Hamiltonella defensa]
MMQYQKAGLLGMLLLSVALVLAGCKDKGEAFVGHWVQVGDIEKPASLDIKFDDGVFHVNYSWHTPFIFKKGDETLRVKKLEAKAESDNVLSLINGFGQTMRLNEGVISFDNAEFKKKD